MCGGECLCVEGSVCVGGGREVWGGGGGKSSHEPPCGIPWLLGYGLANCTTWTGISYCSMYVFKSFAKNKKALKTKKFNFLHAMSKTRIACWNTTTCYHKTMSEKNIELLAISESCWTGCGITRICSTTIVHSGSPSNHVQGIAIASSPYACSSWEAAGSVFHPISERIIPICLKTYLPYASVISIYAPTNYVSTNAEASVQSDNFYDLL